MSRVYPASSPTVTLYWISGKKGCMDVAILTRPFSTSLVVITITLVLSCHTICQKSLTVVARHP